MSSDSSVKIFVSYSDLDAEYLAKDSLLGYLQGLEQQQIAFWTDKQIKTGEKWDAVIKSQLRACDIALVLVSQTFLDSDYCRNVEIAGLLADTKYLFPVILSPCHWQIHDWLASRQFLPSGDQTLEEYFSEKGARKRLFLEIRKQLLERAELIRQARDQANTLIDTNKLDPLQAYYEKCLTRWSQERYALDQRFVDLTLLLDQGGEAQGPRWQAQSERFQSLSAVIARTQEPLVVLGAPGSGKSTLLRHFELENARNGLAALAAEEPVGLGLTFFIQLNDFKAPGMGEAALLPLDWLAGRWAQLNPDLPSLQSLMQQGRMTLLLDALNEMPYRSAEGIALWLEFLADLELKTPQTRVIFSCRFLDYSSQLSVKDRPVVQVRIEALDDEKVRAFLELYSPAHGADLWRKLKDSQQLAVFRSPYFLKMLLAVSEGGELPKGRAALFTALIWRLLKREIENPQDELFKLGAEALLDEDDIARIRSVKRGKTAWELPSYGLLIPN